MRSDVDRADSDDGSVRTLEEYLPSSLVVSLTQVWCIILGSIAIEE